MRDCDGAFEDYDVGIDRQRRPWRTEWLAVAIASISMLTTLGSWAWWGGGLEERVSVVERNDEKQDSRITDVARENIAQGRAQERTGAQYDDIIRRLADIDRKLDRDSGERR